MAVHVVQLVLVGVGVERVQEGGLRHLVVDASAAALQVHALKHPVVHELVPHPPGRLGRVGGDDTLERLRLVEELEVLVHAAIDLVQSPHARRAHLGEDV